MYAISKVMVFLILLIACVPAAAQTATPTQQAGAVAGRITVAGKGVVYATVMLFRYTDVGSSPVKATTDQEGRYTFNNIAAGQYRIVASAPAYVLAAGQNLAASGKTVAIGEGETVENVDFSLVRGGVVTGRITDSRGKPLIGERVYLIGDDGQALLAQLHTTTVESLSTDDRGTFRAFGLPAGRYLVAVGEGDSAGRTGTYALRTAYRRTYYPEATEQSQAKAVNVTEGGEVTGVDITVGQTLKKYTAAGRILDEATGKPPVNVMINSRTITADNKEQPGVGIFTQPDIKGNFRLEGLVPGRYVATIVRGEGYVDPVPFEITDKNVTGLELRVKRGATVNGLAVLTGVADPQAATQLGNLQIRAYIGQGLAMQRFLGEVKLNPDGSFRVAGVTPGTLILSLTPTEATKNFSLVQVERDGAPRANQALQANGVTIAPGEQDVTVKVVIGYGMGTVRGQVKLEEGELPQGAQVIAAIFAADKPGPPLQHARVDARGRFVFEGLPPGEYEVTIQAPIVPPGGGNPQWLQRAREKVFVTSGSESQVALTIDLSPGKKQDMRLKVGLDQ